MVRSRVKSKKPSEEEKAKTKARKSGPSFLRKASQLGVKANIPAFGGYWEPTHGLWRSIVHVPHGWGGFDAKTVGTFSSRNIFKNTDQQFRLRTHYLRQDLGNLWRNLNYRTLQTTVIEPVNQNGREDRPGANARRRGIDQ